VELARQMTLLDYALFQKIRPSEYNNVAWTKKNKEIASPNLLRFIRRFNDVSIWVQNTILSGKSAKKRAALVDNFAKAAVAFRKLNNFNGVMQIVSAMEGAAVHRLQKTFERVRPKSRTKYAELLELMSSSGSYKFYREVRHTRIGI
jgi:son of sevenless-like protein